LNEPLVGGRFGLAFGIGYTLAVLSVAEIGMHRFISHVLDPGRCRKISNMFG
jgi:hypothetical protein